MSSQWSKCPHLTKGIWTKSRDPTQYALWISLSTFIQLLHMSISQKNRPAKVLLNMFTHLSPPAAAHMYVFALTPRGLGCRGVAGRSLAPSSSSSTSLSSLESELWLKGYGGCTSTFTAPLLSACDKVSDWFLEVCEGKRTTEMTERKPWVIQEQTSTTAGPAYKQRNTSGWHNLYPRWHYKVMIVFLIFTICCVKQAPDETGFSAGRMSRP